MPSVLHSVQDDMKTKDGLVLYDDIDAIGCKPGSVAKDEDAEESQTVLQFRQAAGSLSWRSIVLIYLGLSAALLTSILDKSMEGAVLPNVLSVFDSLNLIGMVSMVTYIISAVTQPTWAKISDLVGRMETFIIATAVYVAGNIMNAASQEIVLYMTGVCFSAVGVIGLTVMCQIVIADIFPLRHRGKWQSYFEINKVAMAWAGPYLGEAILNINWRFIYVILAVCGVISIIPVAAFLRLPRIQKIVPKKSGVGHYLMALERKLDLIGMLLLGSMSCGFLFALKYGGTKWDWESPTSISLFCLGITSLATLFWYEYKIAPEPLLPREIMLNRTAVSALMVTVSLSFASAGYSAYRSLYLQVVLDYTPAQAGVFSGYYSTAATASSILAGYLMTWTGTYRRWMHLGAAINTVGLYMVAFIYPDRAFWYIAIAECCKGFGGGMITCPGLVACQGSVKLKHVASATAFFGFFKYFGSAVGTAVYSGI